MDDHREVPTREVVTIEALQTRQTALDLLKNQPMPEAAARQQIEALGFTITGTRIIMPDAYTATGRPLAVGYLKIDAGTATIS